MSFHLKIFDDRGEEVVSVPLRAERKKATSEEESLNAVRNLFEGYFEVTRRAEPAPASSRCVEPSQTSPGAAEVGLAHGPEIAPSPSREAGKIPPAQERGPAAPTPLSISDVTELFRWREGGLPILRHVPELESLLSPVEVADGLRGRAVVELGADFCRLRISSDLSRFFYPLDAARAADIIESEWRLRFEDRLQNGEAARNPAEFAAFMASEPMRSKWFWFLRRCRAAPEPIADEDGAAAREGKGA